MATSIAVGDRRHSDINHVPLLRSFKWVRAGWDDLRNVGSPSFGHGALIATLGAVLLLFGSSHVYLIAAAVSGYLLVGPIMTTGLCELSRRRAAGEPAGFDDSLQGMSRNPKALVQFGAILAVIAIAWFAISEAMLRSVPGSSGSILDALLWGGVAGAFGREQILAYAGTGAVLAGVVFAVSVISVPLIIDRHASARHAMWVSIKATLYNLPTMLVWSALIVALTAIGFATLLVGMVYVAPLLGHATWHAYRDLVR